MKKLFTKILAMLLVCMFVISGFNFSILASDTESSGDLGDKLKAMNVELAGRIKMLFYFTNVEDNVDYYKVYIPDADGDGPYEAETRTVNVSDMTVDANGRYVLEVSVAAAQQSVKVQITPYKNGVAGKTRNYSVRDYVDLAVKQSTTDATKDALYGMLNYGAMAQIAFGYNTDNLANSGLFFGETNPVNNMTANDMYGIKQSEKTATDSDQLSFTEVKGYLQSSVGLRCYISYTGSIENLRVTVDGLNCGNDIFTDENGNYVLIDNINASKFNHQYSIIVTDGTNTVTLQYSVLNYLQGLIETSEDASVINTAYAMFAFYVNTFEYANPSVAVSGKPSSCTHKRSYVKADTLKEICSDCGEDVTPTGIVENANALANGVTSYFGTNDSAGGGTVDGDRGNYVIENDNMSLYYPLTSTESRLVTLTNKDGDVYVEDTMDVYVTTSDGTYYASTSNKSATANIYRYGYYYYDIHTYGQNFLGTSGANETVGSAVSFTNFATRSGNFLSGFTYTIAGKDISYTEEQGKNAYNNSSLQFTISSTSDPGVWTATSTSLYSLSTTSDNALQVTMTTTSSTMCQLYYAVDPDGDGTYAYTTDYSIDFALIADGEAHTYTVPLDSLPSTQTAMYGLRFDFNGEVGETITISSVKTVTIDKNGAPELLLDRGFHTYSDKLHQAISIVAPNGGVAVTEVGMITEVTDVTKLYIKDINGNEYEKMDSGATISNVAYAGFLKTAGVFGYILPKDDDHCGSISVYYDGTSYTITQTFGTSATIKQQPTIYGSSYSDVDTWITNNATNYGTSADKIYSSTNIYRSPTQFYFGQRIYTDTETTFDKFVKEAEKERNPLGAANIKINTEKTPGATFDGYDAIRGTYVFTVSGGVGFGEGYYTAQNYHGGVSFSVTGDSYDRNMYVLAYSNYATVEGGAVLDSNDRMLPIPVEVSKNFGHEYEEPIWLWGDVKYSESRIAVQVNAGETEELTVLQLYMNWGQYPLKQLSSIQFFAPYYHLSTGVTETNCIANYYVHGKDLQTLPDHRAMSGTWWADNTTETGDPQHDNAGYHQWLKYTDSSSKTVTSEPVSSVINSSGPTYADIDMTYISDDGKIKVTYKHMEMPQVDEMRTYYTMTYTVLGDVTISNFTSDFSFYSVYGYGNGYQKFGYYGTLGAVNGISADTTATYTLGSDCPYFDMYSIDNEDSNGNQNSQNANTSFLILNWSTTNSTLNSTSFVVNVENRKASLSLNADEVTLRAGDTITINAIVMPWGTYESTDDTLVQNVRLNSLKNPIVATAHDSSATVVENTGFLPTVKSADGVYATFKLSQTDYSKNPTNKTVNTDETVNGINIAFRVDGFKIITTPKLYESTDGGSTWSLVDISSSSNPDRAGNSHEYDGYAVHYNSDGTYSYSFVTNITNAERLFKVVVDDTYVEWEENHTDVVFNAEAIYKYASEGNYFGNGTAVSEDGTYVTLVNDRTSGDVCTDTFSMYNNPSAKYLVLKYRYANGVTPDNIQFFVETKGQGFTGSGDNFCISSSIVKADGEWHVMVIDLEKIVAERSLTAMEKNSAGAYSITSFRLDPFTTTDTTVSDRYDVEYIAFCRDLDSAVAMNSDMDVANISYVTGIATSTSMSDKLEEDAAGEQYSDMNVIFYGQNMIDSMTLHSNTTAELNGDGNVLITKNTSGEGYFSLPIASSEAAKINTGKYLVFKYRSSGTSLSTGIFSSTSGYSATGSGDGKYDNAMTADGEWHVKVYDLTAISAVVANDAGEYQVNFVRLDAATALAVGETIEFAYVGVCDELSDIPVEAGDLIDYSYKNNIDYVYTDGNESTNLKESTSIDATTVKYVGWLGVANQSAANISYVVTDKYGLESEVNLTLTENDDSSVANRYLVGSSDIQSAVSSLGTDTVGYSVRFTADLSKWAGQTVTLSIRETLPGGAAVETYSITVNVPKAADPAYISGEMLWDKLSTSKFSGTLNDDGSLTITSTAADGDGALTITDYASGLTPKYAVIKYKTTNHAGTFALLATTEGNEIGGYVNSTVNTDGEWHTLVVDLTMVSSGYVYGDTVSFFRLDVCEGATGYSMTIDHVYLCEELSEYAGEIVDITSGNSVDSIYADGDTDNDLRASTSIEATTVYYKGWLRVNGLAATGVSYVITDENGNEIVTKLTLGDTDQAVTNTYYERTDVTKDAVNNSAWSNDTVGYGIIFEKDLSEYAGQTVTISIRETVAGAAIVEIYSFEVTVPAGSLTISGADLAGYVSTTFHNYVVNDDDSLTITWKSGTDTYTNNFAALLDEVAAPQYAVIKYKTTTETSIVMLANTSGDPGPYTAAGTTTDGQWRYAIIDFTTLTNTSVYTVGETVTFMRINCCNAEGDNLTIGSITFCDDFSELPFFHLCIDSVYMDGDTTTDLKADPTLTGSTIKFTGWVGVNGHSATAINYVVTDANGVTTTDACSGWNFARTDITAGASGTILGANYQATTVGFGGNVTVDLADWAGQTVTFSLVATLDDGSTVDFYSAEVSVPKSADPNYVIGSEMVSGVNTGEFSYTLNDDGSITVTNLDGAADGTITFNSMMNGTPKYAVIRYKNSGDSTLYVYAKTTDTDEHSAVNVALHTDGMWHVAVIDLTAQGKYTVGGTLELMRFDIAESTQGRTFTLDYVWFTDDISDVEYEVYDKLDVVWVGQGLVDMMTTGTYVGGIGGVTLNEDGTVTAYSSGEDAYFGDAISGGIATGQYLVIKYRTQTGTNVRNGQFNVLAATTGNTYSEHGVIGSAVADCRWHTLVLNLADLGGVAVSDDGSYYLSYFRADFFDQFVVGGKIDFAYIGLCDDLSDITLEEGEYLELGWQQWKGSIGTVQIDGTSQSKDGIDFTYKSPSCGASDRTYTYSGTTWTWDGVWFAIDGRTPASIGVCVTEEDGTEHWTAGTFSGRADLNENCSGGYYAVMTLGYAEGTLCYSPSLGTISLSDYAGQTVTLSVRVLTDDGYAVTIYSILVTVPEA